ncbi:MAG: ribonuclease III, partial [Nevskia sp.]|nr:ribonuclease III [Nevskia sp.]
LQETLQARGRPLPEYAVLNEAGPPHRRRFRVRCRLPDTGQESEGEGGSRRQAEQQAAQAMLDQVEAGDGRHA